jgi:hypothetical protein
MRLNKNLVYTTIFVTATLLFGATQMTNLNIINSTINSSTVGAAHPSTGAFTTMNAFTSVTTPYTLQNVMVVSPPAFALGPWSPQGGTTEGANISWDNSGATGETDFINQRSVLGGGFNWYNTNGSTVGSPLMTLSGGGTLTTTTFAGAFTGNVTGSLSGSLVTATTGQFGNLVAGCTGCGASVWSPGSFSQGSWLAFGNSGGSNVETDFINHYSSGTGGFSWWSTTASSLSSPLMNLNTSGVLTVNRITGTASALTTSPSNCGAQRAPTGIDASGTAQNCGPQILYGSTSSVCTTPSGSGSVGNACTTSVPWTSGTFASGTYTATCTGLNPSGVMAPSISIIGQTTTAVSVTLESGTASQAGAASYGSISCIGIAP